MWMCSLIQALCPLSSIFKTYNMDFSCLLAYYCECLSHSTAWIRRKSLQMMMTFIIFIYSTDGFFLVIYCYYSLENGNLYCCENDFLFCVQHLWSWQKGKKEIIWLCCWYSFIVDAIAIHIYSYFSVLFRAHFLCDVKSLVSPSKAANTFLNSIDGPRHGSEHSDGIILKQCRAAIISIFTRKPQIAYAVMLLNQFASQKWEFNCMKKISCMRCCICLISTTIQMSWRIHSHPTEVNRNYIGWSICTYVYGVVLIRNWFHCRNTNVFRNFQFINSIWFSMEFN